MTATKLPDKRWYVVQTYSGLENSVKANLERRIESMQMEDLIFSVVIPEEIRLEKKADGSTKEKLVKLYPGYIFIELIVTDDSWFVVRNTPGVTGFLGSSGGGTKPIPLPPEEINPILKKAGLLQTPKLDVKIGQKVRVTSGPFTNQIGIVDEIDAEKGEVTVLVEMFGRQTPAELKFDEIDPQ
ncbi:transcription termination/antitermination protein NusG [Liberiplasma polymorphum]|jgi:transcription termination/antitermination protein NusG|uniref:transcription termination/antitermination protein NusG n=1 Tax=Liberiplasma polymorphum TaxID=3374570 RepID=UPI003771868B